jgi:WXG100 family type VII secretion target
MAPISLDPDQARSTASTFDSSKGSIEGELSRLTGSTNEVLGGWSGQSRQQFEGEWDQWTQRLRSLLEELQGLAGGLRREAEEFEAADRSFRS